MIIVIAVLLAAVFLVALSIGGNLARIAAAIEAQNRAYGIPERVGSAADETDA